MVTVCFEAPLRNDRSWPNVRGRAECLVAAVGDQAEVALSGPSGRGPLVTDHTILDLASHIQVCTASVLAGADPV